MDKKYHDLEEELVEALALAALDEYEHSSPAEEDTDASINEDDALSRAIDQQRRQQDEDGDSLNIPDVLPVLPLKDVVIYPFAVQPLGVGQERSIRLIDDVMRGDRLVVLVAQRSVETEQAGPDDIYRIGTVSRVARLIRLPGGPLQTSVQ